MSAFWAIVGQEVKLATRVGGGGGLAVFFFLVAITLIPLGIGPNMPLLAKIAPGILWVILLLSCLLTLDRLFQTDFEDGTLDQLMLSPLPLELLVLAKVVGHWLTTGLPLILASPLMALMLNLDPQHYPMLMLTMLVGSPALSLLGAIGAGLTVGIRRGGLLISLLVLPFYMPVLIFGVGALRAVLVSSSGDLALRNLALLGALSLLCLVLGPVAGAAGLRANLR